MNRFVLMKKILKQRRRKYTESFKSGKAFEDTELIISNIFTYSVNLQEISWIVDA